jgi:hypothetical protein
VLLNISYNSIESSLKGRCWGGICLKRPKKGKKGQILQSHNTAQFVQYGKIRVKYDTAYYTNTLYDTSLVGTLITDIHLPLHAQCVAGGAQVGRVEQGGIPCQDFQKLLQQLTRGTFIDIPDILVKVRGSGVKVLFWTLYWQGNYENQGFGRDTWIAKLMFATSSV